MLKIYINYTNKNSKMKISFENPDKVNGLMTISVEEEDYKENVEKKLKEYRKKANIPGFRPGMVPMGLIKRQFGATVKMDVINNLLGENLQKYIVDNNIQMLGKPMGNEEQEPVDIEKGLPPYEFKFDIAVAHASLGGEVDDYCYLVFGENCLHGCLIGDGGVDKGPVALQRLYLLQAFILDVDIVVVGDAVDADHLDVLDIMEQALDEVATDKAGGACDEDGLALEGYIIFYHCCLLDDSGILILYFFIALQIADGGGYQI